jgi:hypothetical protein
MKIPLDTECDECGIVTIHVDLGRSASDPRCPKGHELPCILTTSVPVGHMIWRKAQYEFHHNRDYSMTIVLAAAALESEVSRLHKKWEQIRGIDNGDWIDGETLDAKLRSYKSIVVKIEGVAALVHPRGLQNFLDNSDGLRETIAKGFPSVGVSTLASDLQKLLFWPRNRILHAGYGGHTEADAIRCLNLALLGLRVFQEMDRSAVKASHAQ